MRLSKSKTKAARPNSPKESASRKIKKKTNRRIAETGLSSSAGLKKMKPKDSFTTAASLKKIVSDFCGQRGWDSPHNPKDLAVGAVTEASELLELFRFCSEEQSYEMVKNKNLRERMSEELADTLCFLLRFAELYKFDVTNSLEDKLAKTALKYPIDKKN